MQKKNQTEKEKSINHKKDMTRFGGSSKKLDSNKSNFTNHFKDLTSPLHDPSALLPRNATPRRLLPRRYDRDSHQQKTQLKGKTAHWTKDLSMSLTTNFKDRTLDTQICKSTPTVFKSEN